jgi:hypothetical protein
LKVGTLFSCDLVGMVKDSWCMSKQFHVVTKDSEPEIVTAESIKVVRKKSSMTVKFINPDRTIKDVILVQEVTPDKAQ